MTFRIDPTALALSVALAALSTAAPAQMQYLDVGQAEAEAPTQEEEGFQWTLEKTGPGAVSMSGALPSAAMQRYLAVRVGGAVDDTTAISEGAPEGFIPDALVATQVMEALAEGVATFDDGAWRIVGRLAPDADPEDLRDLIVAEARDGAAWTLELESAEAATPADDQIDIGSGGQEPAVVETQPQPPEPSPDPLTEGGGAEVAPIEPPAASEPEPEPEPEAPTPSDPVSPDDLEDATQDDPREDTAPQAVDPAPSAEQVDCEQRVGAVMAEGGILFASGSARLLEESRGVIAEVGAVVALCPDMVVYVEGHTDSDGSDALNLALSVSRAEAVVDELIGLGVAPSRLYAVGYGASLPIASNETADGKRQNRRIVFTFADEHRD